MLISGIALFLILDMRFSWINIQSVLCLLSSDLWILEGAYSIAISACKAVAVVVVLSPLSVAHIVQTVQIVEVAKIFWSPFSWILDYDFCLLAFKSAIGNPQSRLPCTVL